MSRVGSFRKKKHDAQQEQLELEQEAIAERFSNLEKKLADVEKRGSDIDSRLRTQARRLADLEPRLAEMDKSLNEKIDDVTGKLTGELLAKLESLDRKTTDTAVTVAATIAMNNGHGNTIEDMVQRLSEMEAKLEAEHYDFLQAAAKAQRLWYETTDRLNYVELQFRIIAPSIAFLFFAYSAYRYFFAK